MSKRLPLFLAALAGLILSNVSNLRADAVVALPGSNSLGANVSVLEINPLNSIGNITAGDGAFIVLPKSDGSKYYVVAKSPTNSVTTVNSTFTNPTSIVSFDTSPTAAAITPDGTKLLVASATLHIFDTTKDQELVPGGVTPVGAGTVVDVAISLDGTKAYTLGLSSAGGSQVNEVSLSNNSPTGLPSYAFSGTATAIAVGPNGLVYVSTQNQIIELNPTTLQPTTSGGITGVNALPGKLVFTPDGKYALAVNQTPQTTETILLLSLTASPHTYNWIPTTEVQNVTFDTLLVANSTTIFAFSSTSQALYQLGISSQGNLAIAGASIGGAPISFVNGVAISNELPYPGNVIAHYLFVAASPGGVSPATLYRVDLTAGPTITAQTTLPNQQFNALDYISLPSTNPAEVLLAYGDKQTVAASSTSLPLVVQALDNAGKPVTGVPVTFSANVNTASVSPTTATTGSNGFAQTTLTTPASNGTIVVTASVGKLQASFTINVGAATTVGAGTMTIVAGQGQLIAPDTSTNGSPYDHLTVQVSDVNGNPVSGTTVTFTVTPTATASGPGTLSLAAGFKGSATVNGIAVTTNAQGQAAADFLSTVTSNGLGYSQTAITAKSSATNSVIFYETTYPINPADTPLVTFETPAVGASLSGSAGTVIPGFSANVSDVFGSPIPNVSVHTCSPSLGTGQGSGGIGGVGPSCPAPAANAPLPFGTCNDPTGQGVLSDAHGNVTCNLLLNGVLGTGTIGASYGNHFQTLSFPLTITAGPPGKMIIVQGNNQTGKPGQQLPQALVVQLQDSFGNVLANYSPVTFTVQSTGAPASLSNPNTGTDGAGDASTLVTLGTTAGAVIVQATAGNVSQSFALTVNNPAAGIQQVSGNNQSVLVGTAFGSSLVVEVTDNQGNPVSGAPVTFTINSGSATLGTTSTTTGVTGQASTTVTAGSAPGNIVIVAAAGSFNTTFTLSAHLAGFTNVVFVNGASTQVQPGCQPLGCVAPGEIVTIQGQGFATGVQGVVSGFSILGPLPTTLAGLSVSFNGVLAPIFNVANVNGAESITVQVPLETPVGSTAVVLTGAGGQTANYTIPTQLYAPGVFTNTYGNQTIAVVIRSDGSYVSPTNPVQPGETIYVYVTGLGQTSPAAVTNTPGAGQAATATVITGLNNKGVPHTTVEYAPGLVGVYIIAVQVPLNVQSGQNQPFGLILTDTAGNTYHCETTFVPIQ